MPAWAHWGIRKARVNHKLTDIENSSRCVLLIFLLLRPCFVFLLRTVSFYLDNKKGKRHFPASTPASLQIRSLVLIQKPLDLYAAIVLEMVSLPCAQTGKWTFPLHLWCWTFLTTFELGIVISCKVVHFASIWYLNSLCNMLLLLS